MHNINDNTVQGRLSEDSLTRKIFAQNISHEIFTIYSTWCLVKGRPHTLCTHHFCGQTLQMHGFLYKHFGNFKGV